MVIRTAVYGCGSSDACVTGGFYQRSAPTRLVGLGR